MIDRINHLCCRSLCSNKKDVWWSHCLSTDTQNSNGHTADVCLIWMRRNVTEEVRGNSSDQARRLVGDHTED
jgi:hypothetical protein